MKSFFELFGDAVAPDRVMYLAEDGEYAGRDVIVLSCLYYRILAAAGKNFKNAVIATDNPLHICALLPAAWLLGMRVFQPNTLRPDGFEPFRSEDTLCLVCEDEVCEEAAARFPDSLRLLNLAGVAAVYGRFRKKPGFFGRRKDGSADAAERLAALLAAAAGNPDLRRGIRALPELEACRAADPDFLGGDDFRDFAAKALAALADPAIEENFTITALTSGSTGVPKKVPRTLGDFLREVELVRGIYPPGILDGTVCAATVSNFHAYGIMFRFFVPLMFGIPSCAFTIAYQEQLEKLGRFGRPLFFVTSPGFLKRLDVKKSPVKVRLMMSAGGILRPGVLARAKAVLGAPVLEIYGSTETGVMACRFPEDGTEPWTVPAGTRVFALRETEEGAFEAAEKGHAAGPGFPPGIEADTSGTGRIGVVAPHVNAGTPYIGSDVISFEEPEEGRQAFRLFGRDDRVIKLEDNRVSLDEIEGIVLAHPYIKECAIIKYTVKNREYTGALAVLSEEGVKEYFAAGPGKFVIGLRGAFGDKMLRVAVPRKFVFVRAIPVTENGKTAYGRIRETYFGRENS